MAPSISPSIEDPLLVLPSSSPSTSLGPSLSSGPTLPLPLPTSIPESKPLASTSPPPSFVNTDLEAVRNEYVFRPPAFVDRWVVSLLRDHRDAPLAYLILNICFIAVPCAIALFFIPNPSHWHGFAYLAISCGLFLQRFILCLHYTEHLQPFKTDTVAGWILAQLCPNVLCVLYGIPPGIYRLHHVVMHHCENNLFRYDISSTEPYQRDNFFQFLGYWFRFWLCVAYELPLYALIRRRFSLFFRALISLSIYVALGRYLFYVSPVAALWVLVIPFFIASFAMMFGNWSQHVFVDPLRSRNNYALTYNVVNTTDNQRTFNDGYHIIHHVNSKIHWCDLPQKFMDTLDKHAEEDALVFEGIGFFDVGVFVFTGQLRALAKRYVNIGQKQRSIDELVELMKERLRPIRHTKQE